MRISVYVKCGCRQEKVEKVGQRSFKVWVKPLAKEGRANSAVVEALGRHFCLPKSGIAIIKGHCARHKVIEAAI